ncbi:MAG: hypothetical protein GEV05_24300 [Betaproteobacteria bacterium]|nr:hypothetical protein [Betaproteobacteria bacterium]
MKRTAIMMILGGLVMGYICHIDSAEGQERIVADGAISHQQEAVGYSDEARMNLTALITRTDPKMERQGMSQQDAECAYYAKHGKGWQAQASDWYEGADRCQHRLKANAQPERDDLCRNSPTLCVTIRKGN